MTGTPTDHCHTPFGGSPLSPCPGYPLPPEACSEACESLDPRSANLKREEKGDRKDDAKKTDDGSTEKSKDADDQKPGPSERSRATKSGKP